MSTIHRFFVQRRGIFDWFGLWSVRGLCLKESDGGLLSHRTQGKSRSEAIANAEEAIRGWLASQDLA